MQARVQLRRFGTVGGYRKQPKPIRIDLPTAAERNAREQLEINAERNDVLTGRSEFLKGALEAPGMKSSFAQNAVHRPWKAPPSHLGTTRQQIYPGEPHNFQALRPIPQGFDVVARAVRERPWESRFDIFI